MTNTEKLAILTQNLNECEQNCRNLQECKEIHLHQLWKAHFPTDENFSQPSREELLAKYHSIAPLILAKTPRAEIMQKISFVREIATRMDVERLLEQILPEIRTKDNFSSPTIAFWQEHKDSADAYVRFRDLFEGATPLHVKRFGDIYDVLANGIADFGILPIENSADGKLFGFYRMLERGDFLICATCNMEHSDKDVHTKYALVSKNTLYFSERLLLRLELSFYSIESHHLFELIQLLNLLGILLERIDSLPLHYQTDGIRVYTVLSVEREILPIFLCYLWLFEADYSILGLFIHIEKD